MKIQILSINRLNLNYKTLYLDTHIIILKSIRNQKETFELILYSIFLK